MRHLFITKSRITTYNDMDGDELEWNYIMNKWTSKSRAMPASLCVGLFTPTLTLQWLDGHRITNQQMLVDQVHMEIQIIHQSNLSNASFAMMYLQKSTVMSFWSLVLALVALVALVCKCCTMAVQHSGKRWMMFGISAVKGSTPYHWFFLRNRKTCPMVWLNRMKL